MKTYDLIAFVRRATPSRVMSKADLEKFGRTKLLIVHILQHHNQTLFEENKEAITDFINEQIDLSQKQMQAAQDLAYKYLENWQGVQSKLIGLVVESEVEHEQ